MANPARSGRPVPGYSIRFAATALITVALALVLVLVVLPRRYVLSSGFQESGVSFPTMAEVPPRPAGVAQPAPPRRAPVLAVNVPRGPAERFWDEVIPLLNAGEREAALERFESYLALFPDDRDVRREYAVTLLQAGRPDEATAQLRRLLAYGEDPELRLLLARTLRDRGRMDAASAQYAFLASRGVDGPELTLEWARALSWVELYGDALSVLDRGLAADPEQVPLQVERARVLYYAGRDAAAGQLLESLPEDALARLGALELREDVRAALTEPETPPPPGPTDLERALGVREEGRFREAGRILRSITTRDPGAVDAWLAYANLLQYDLDRREDALEVLERVRELELERWGTVDPALEYRLAQLEIWSGREGPARQRLARLLTRVREDGPVSLPGPVGSSDEVGEADLLALLGDLDRWAGDRSAAARRYRAAMEVEPSHPGARDGLDALLAQLALHLDRTERPRAGGVADAILDSDDFIRLDLAGEWAGVHQNWVWGVRPGRRWLEGLDATGAPNSRQGFFAELQGGRWWRWGTIRTSLSLGVEELGLDDPLVRFGAQVRLDDPSGWSLVSELSRGPAYPVTTTLQSIFLDVVQDALRVSLSVPLTPVWSLWSQAELGRLTWDGGADPSIRALGSVALSARLTETFSAGAELRALGLSAAAPDAGGLPGFWDPRLALSLSPTLTWRDSVGPGLFLSAGAAVGGAWVRERRSAEDGELLPVASLLGGLEWRTDDFRADADLFYRQSRFAGYRNWGGTLTMSVPLSVGGYE